MEAADVHRLQFAFTVTFHYLFPQFTMGLALLIFILKTMALRGDEEANRAARFWLKLFGLSFALGVVTGIPLEFQFGTNWARFSKVSGGIIGQTLAMEGVFAFFLEAAFLYFLLYREEQLGRWGHWAAALLVFLGSWLSGYFIVCTNAWMQHPVGFEMQPDGSARLISLWALLSNRWALIQYLHNMAGAAITGSFCMAGIGALYLLRGVHINNSRRFLSVSVVVGLAASVLAAVPTGDWEAKLVYQHQPAAFAAMEGHFHTEDSAAMVLIGQPNMETLRLDNPIKVPGLLSFLTHQRWNAPVKGLAEFPPDQWPQFVPLVYYSYHIMAGLGTLFIVLMALASFFAWRRTLFAKRGLLWALMLAWPFPFIANTLGWVTAETGRQPWIIYGLLRTAQGSSQNVSSGNVGFTLLGFLGLYVLLAIIYLVLFLKILRQGPESEPIQPMPA
ncbi:MAG: cytochrome ubiquinol oxidase subunit I [Verrucomicrobia bacterium]|nr:MAG: cytochrome ubiquinol oxidase subunit I [Verrucomicrobiota bacterium]